MAEPNNLIALNEEAGRLASVTGADRISLPTILDGYHTLSVEEKVRRFALGVPEMLERWISRRASPHTRRAYRQDLFTFIGFINLRWPDEAVDLFAVTVAQVQDYRDWMLARGDAPKTVNRRVSSLAGFFRFLREDVALTPEQVLQFGHHGGPLGQEAGLDDLIHVGAGKDQNAFFRW
jgi:hypothetical protein